MYPLNTDLENLDIGDFKMPENTEVVIEMINVLCTLKTITLHLDCSTSVNSTPIPDIHNRKKDSLRRIVDAFHEKGAPLENVKLMIYPRLFGKSVNKETLENIDSRVKLSF